MARAKSTASMIKAFKKSGGVTVKLPDHNKPPTNPKVGLSKR